MEMDVNRGLPYMLSVEEAQARILGMFRTLESERKPLLDALGQVLAEDVVSTLDIPPLTNSAMDGYAVRYEAIAGATYDNPRELRVIGHLAAGQLPEQEVSGVNAVRIMTGAPIPSGADTVAPFEETDEFERKGMGMGPLDITEIMVRTDVPRGSNLRPAGQDVQKGQMVLEKGALLRPSEIGVLASLGRDTVEVTRRPVVAVIATGMSFWSLESPPPPARYTIVTATVWRRPSFATAGFQGCWA